jgi:site-specific recombinase XerD
MTPAPFTNLLHTFFHEWLGQQRNLSRHTVLSYRDTWRLFLRFVSTRQHRPIVALSLSDMDTPVVLAFLQYLEKERGVSIGTRNCRLSALHAFFAYVAQKEPTAIAQCAAIAHIPTKKTSHPAMAYLEADEVEAILKQPDQSKLVGQRDYVLLAFLYNTGARIQEALDVTLAAIRFDPPAQVELFGKGRKTRVCPLWPETVKLIKALLKRNPRDKHEQIFVNCYGRPLGQVGVRFKLNQYVQRAAKTMPSLTKKDISPHSFRHYVSRWTVVQLRKGLSDFLGNFGFSGADCGSITRYSFAGLTGPLGTRAGDRLGGSGLAFLGVGLFSQEPSPSLRVLHRGISVWSVHVDVQARAL